MNFDITTLLCRSRNLLCMFERQCESVLSISTLFNEKASIVAVNMYVKLKVALYKKKCKYHVKYFNWDYFSAYTIFAHNNDAYTVLFQSVILRIRARFEDSNTFFRTFRHFSGSSVLHTMLIRKWNIKIDFQPRVYTVWK